MILVDSSVWIDHYRGTPSNEVQFLHRVLEENGDLCTCGIVLTEVLQGVRTDPEFQHVQDELLQLPCLPLSREACVEAAGIYRACRARGLPAPASTDCLIAACALAHRAIVLHKDRHYLSIADVTGLKVVPIPSP